MSRPPTRHSRHPSTVSTSSVILSTSTSHSPSPSASPVSPTYVEGLSRRLSWNRPKDEGLSVQDAHTVIASSSPTLPAPQASRFLGPEEEHEIAFAHPLGSSLREPERQSEATRPYFHQYPATSSTSFESGASGDETPDRDGERLTFAPPEGHGHRRVPSRAYDENGNPRTAGIHTRVAGAVTRNPTFRNVSRTLRNASVRVVNVLGTNDDGAGRVRLDDEGDEGDEDGKSVKMKELGEPPVLENQGTRPDPMPPELPTGLRGRTLCFFSPASRIRKAMDRLLRLSWTEPAILLLIIANVVVLAIQSAPPLNEPRRDDGYFRSWADFALLGLFGIFTLEMFARMVVTGLIFDPETSIQQWLFGPTGVATRWSHRLLKAQSTLQRATSRTPRAAWRSQSEATVPRPKRKATVVPEAPFQNALAKQQSLNKQGRPYLRHSWHRIDMIAIVAFWITFFLAVTGQEATADRHLYIFRALSILRAGRLLVITSGTTTILHSLKRAGPLLITVSFFLIFAFSLFSIIGVQSFRGSFRRQCVLLDPFNATNEIELEGQCGGFWIDDMIKSTYLNLDGSTADVASKGYICPMNQVCKTASENPNNGGNSFDNVFVSLVQVVIITSINTWAPLMYMSMDSDYFASSLYFLVAVIILNFWLVNLLTAVVVNTFKDIRTETHHSAFGADDGPIASDPAWSNAASKRKSAGVIMRLYAKTELIWVALALASLVAQGAKTARSSQSTLDLLSNIELALTLAFDLEIAIRIIGHYPDWKAFLARPRNSFDLFLVIMTSIIQIPAIQSSSVYPWLTIFQLLRWYRVILAFPRMRPLVVTVFGSFWGMFNMVIFLFLINFLGALMAVQLFRGDLEAGETITWSQTYNSFLGMYQVFSSEDWTTVMYTTMGGSRQFAQSWLAAAFFCVWFLFSNAVVLQMFIAVINENFAVAEEQKRKRQIEEFIRKSEPVSVHVSWIDRLNPYRLMTANRNAVKVSSLPPNLVLPLKQNVGPDVGALSSKYAEQKDASGAKGAMRRLLGRGDEAKEAVPLRHLRRPRSARLEDLDDDADDARGLSDLLPPLAAGPSADEHMDSLRERRNQQADFITAHPTFDHSLWLFRQSNPIRRFCQACVSPAYGERIFGRPANPILRLALKGIVFCAIVASVVVAAIASPEYRKTYYEANGLYRGTWFDLVEVALGTTFVAEALIKIIADGFIFAPNAYLLSLWNIMDFLLLVALLINTTTSLIYIGGLSRLTRALKGLRALRLITLFRRLRDTLHAVLFAGALKILDASILMILYLIPFAVWGLNIFAGLLYYCNDGDVGGRSECTGTYTASPVDESLGYLVPRVWANPTLDESKWNFDSFRDSILILFEIVSLEGWIDVMASAMNIVGRDQQPETNYSHWNAIFFVLFNLLGGVIILTLFLSVIIGNFSTRSGQALLTQEQRHWVDLRKYIKAQTASQLPKQRPQTGLRAWCYERATQKHGYWMRTFTVIYYVHILLLMTEDFSNNILTEVEADWIFLFLTILYAIDIVIRFYGLGFNSFRANGWNIFDVVVITGSFATTIPALRDASRGLSGSQVNVQLQKLFLVAVAFKLVQRIGSLNQLFKTSVASLPAIGNLFLLWATLFLLYAIIYLEVFGLTKLGNNAGTRYQNYYSFGNALIMLAFMSTGEGWNGYMHDYTIAYPRCTESTSYFNSDCGSPAWAYGLFISWNIVSMYIFLNMFTGVVVESFAYVYRMPGGASLDREEMRAFKKLWAEFDTERTGYIKRKDFIKFFSRLSGVFEVRLYPIEYSIPRLLRQAVPDPTSQSSGRAFVITGLRRAVDIGAIETLVSRIDYRQVSQRRRAFARLYHEARITEEPGRGIGFTAMLMMLAHNKLIDDEKALLVDDLLVRREKTERVTDLVNLDRVRGLLRTIYWRRRFLASRDERRRTLNAESAGIPAIVLDPTPATPPYDTEVPVDPFHDTSSRETANISPSPSPPGSRSTSPEMRAAAFGNAPDLSIGTPALGHPGRHSPSLSVGGRSRMSSRRMSVSSMLSSDDAHHRGSSPFDDGPPSPSEGYMDAMATSMWGDMMREAVDQEDV